MFLSLLLRTLCSDSQAHFECFFPLFVFELFISSGYSPSDIYLVKIPILQAPCSPDWLFSCAESFLALWGPSCQLLALILGQRESFSESLFLVFVGYCLYFLLTVSGFTLRSSIHLDLGFVQGLISFSWALDTQFFQHYFWRCCLQSVSYEGTCSVCMRPWGQAPALHLLPSQRK